jgi:DNA transposition AAA+ family ATPase
VQQDENNNFSDEIIKIESILSAGFSLDRLANETAIDRQNLDALLSGEYPEGFHYYDLTRDKEKISAWLAEHEQQAVKEFSETPSLISMNAILSKAHRYQEIVSITGGVGIGKTTAARNYVKNNPRGYDRPGAFLVEFKEADKRMTSALERILESMLGARFRKDKQSSSLMMRVVCSNLRQGDLMILDECNRLVDGKSRTIDIARDIYDSTGVGVAMLGNPEFNNKVYGDNGDFDALASRAFRLDFPVTTEGDVDSWIQWKGLGAVGKRVRNELVRIGTNPGARGGLRTLNKLVNEMIGIDKGALPSVERIHQFVNYYGKN